LKVKIVSLIKRFLKVWPFPLRKREGAEAKRPTLARTTIVHWHEGVEKEGWEGKNNLLRQTDVDFVLSVLPEMPVVLVSVE